MSNGQSWRFQVSGCRYHICPWQRKHSLYGIRQTILLASDSNFLFHPSFKWNQLHASLKLRFCNFNVTMRIEKRWCFNHNTRWWFHLRSSFLSYVCPYILILLLKMHDLHSKHHNQKKWSYHFLRNGPTSQICFDGHALPRPLHQLLIYSLKSLQQSLLRNIKTFHISLNSEHEYLHGNLHLCS